MAEPVDGETSSAVPRASKVARACVECGRRRTKCSGAQPCAVCERHGITCEYTAPAKPGRKRKADSLQQNHQPRTISPDFQRLAAGPAPAQLPPSHLPPPHLVAGTSASPASPSVQSEVTPFVAKLFEGHGPHLASYYRYMRQGAYPDGSVFYPPESDSPPHAHPEDVLYRLYWAFFHPLWPAVYRPAYSAAAVRHEYPLLHHAVLAVAYAKNVEPDAVAYPREHALSRLSDANAATFLSLYTVHQRPDVRCVQALILMAFRELTLGFITKSWTFLGMAISMAMELHLNSVEPREDHGGELLRQEISRAVWCCYCADKTFCMLLGRPMRLKKADMVTPFPNTQEADEICHYSADSVGVLPPETVAALRGSKALTMTNFVAWSKLAMILESVLEKIYPQKRKPSAERFCEVPELDEMLQRWRAEYPAVLGDFDDEATATRATTIPLHITEVRMWYQTCILVLHRPFIPYAGLFRRGDRQVSSYDLSVAAADAIFRLVSNCRGATGIGVGRGYGYKHFMLFHSALMFFGSAVGKEAVVVRAAYQKVEQCLSWLDEADATQAFTGRFREVLEVLIDAGRRESGTETPAGPAPPSSGLVQSTDIFNPGFDLGAQLGHGSVQDLFAQAIGTSEESFWSTMPLNGVGAGEWDIFSFDVLAE